MLGAQRCLFRVLRIIVPGREPEGMLKGRFACFDAVEHVPPRRARKPYHCQRAPYGAGNAGLQIGPKRGQRKEMGLPSVKRSRR